MRGRTASPASVRRQQFLLARKATLHTGQASRPIVARNVLASCRVSPNSVTTDLHAPGQRCWRQFAIVMAGTPSAGDHSGGELDPPSRK